MTHTNNTTNGSILIEVFLAIVLLVTLVTGSLSLLYPAITNAEIGRQKLIAGLLLWEEEEAVRQIRDESWTNLTPGTYYPQYNTTSNPPTVYQGWALESGSGVKNGYTENIAITIPNRLNSNTIDTTGTADSNVRKFIYTVTWTSFGYSHTVSLTNYLTNWQTF